VRIVVILLVLLSSACREQRPPAPSDEQSAQLNEAEAMLNDVSDNKEGPEQRPGPSNASD
jgi:hypothetical protein